MKKTLFLVWIALSVRTTGFGQAAEFPQKEIGNGLIHAHFYLPDAEKGYYRGTRFDWSGVIPSLEYQGHQYCGQWFEKYSPTTHDAIMGPVESFTPLGYKEAVPGSGFVQVGVGLLARTDGSPYSPFTYYALLNPGTWQVKSSPAAIEFRHRLKDTAYSYDYIKTIRLVKDRPELVLSHSLKNTGTRIIETDVFDHNFFLPDSLFTQPGFVLKFPFALTSEGARGLDDLAAVRGDSILILRQLTGKQSVYAILHGYGDQASDYDIRVENHITGTGIRITSDRPLSKLVYWGSVKALCPEPYIHIRVLPGETFTWTIRYAFYNTDISNRR